VDSVIEQYIQRVRPDHYEFVEPTKAYADLIIPEGGFNERAMEVLRERVNETGAPALSRRMSAY
jgi:uridine kinase